MCDHEQGLFEVFDDRDDADESGVEPEVVGMPKVFLDSLRANTSRLSDLDVRPGDVFTGYSGDRLWVAISLMDEAANVEYGCVRVDVSAAQWQGAWVSPSLADAHELADAGPMEPTAGASIQDPDRDVATAVAWLYEQLSQPVSRYLWKRDGRLVAELWRVDSTGRSLIASGDPAERSDLGAAETIRVR